MIKQNNPSFWPIDLNCNNLLRIVYQFCVLIVKKIVKLLEFWEGCAKLKIKAIMIWILKETTDVFRML